MGWGWILVEDQLPRKEPHTARHRTPQVQFVQASDVQPYFTLAETYTFGDRMFPDQPGTEFPGASIYCFGNIRGEREEQF